jgi:glycosyltransferase involved in cell wall biosynthesis
MVAKKATKYINKLILLFDCIIFLLFFVSCFIGLPFVLPWILKRRQIWSDSVKGNPKALILREFNVNHIKTVEGTAFLANTPLLAYRNSSTRWTGFLDPVNSLETNIKIADDLELMTLKLPDWIQLIQKIKLDATSIIFREIFAVFKITQFCVDKKIGVICAYKHDYSALRAYIVSRFIKIPYLVDIIGNFELIRRLGGRRYYFQKLHKLPIIGVFSHPLTNWLLGLPLKHAFCVFGRSKCGYEHAFALGTPVERLSLIRISNFNSAFNDYDPQKPPPKPAEFPYVLFVGRLAEIKLPLDVLKAFDFAAADLSNYHLVFIGDGAFRKDLEEIRLSSEYKERISFLGACPSDVVLNWTAHAKIVVCPFSGSTLAEAMLCGNPVIAYDVANHPEIIIDDYTGYLVPFRNIEALAEKMKYVASNYEEAKSVAMRGRELAQTVFNKTKIQEKERIVYQKALAK